MSDGDVYIDLHIHTHYCDGATVDEVIEAIKKENAEIQKNEPNSRVGAIAITDHQEIDGIEAVAERVEKEGLEVEVIPAVELSTYEGFHILGYFIDHHDNHIRAELDRIQRGRRKREREITEKFNEFFLRNSVPLEVPFDDVMELTINGNIAAGHIEKFIYDRIMKIFLDNSERYICVMHSFVNAINKETGADLHFDENMDLVKEKGAVKLIKEDYIRTHLLKRDKPCYVEKTLDDCWKVVEAIKLIKDVKGVPIIAHPGETQLDDKLIALLEAGAEGIEVCSTKHKIGENAHYARMARDFSIRLKRKILMTAGTDWHGQYTPHIDITHTGGIGGMGSSIERPKYDLVIMLKEKRKQLFGV